MIEQILTRKNMVLAMHQVQKNQGSAGVDRMPVTKLSDLMSIDKAQQAQVLYMVPILGRRNPKRKGEALSVWAFSKDKPMHGLVHAMRNEFMNAHKNKYL
ncbi:hypothetical protein [Labilibaculum euxinus]